MLETLEPLAADRKCFRMINGVLIEMTVKDALPPLKTNTEGLKKVEKDLKEQLIAKQKELDEWKVRHARHCGGPSLPVNLSADQEFTNCRRRITSRLSSSRALQLRLGLAWL